MPQPRMVLRTARGESRPRAGGGRSVSPWNSPLIQEFPVALNKLLTVAEMMDILGKKSPQHVHRLVHTDGLPAIRVGRKFMFDPDSVEQWLRDRAVHQ